MLPIDTISLVRRLVRLASQAEILFSASLRLVKYTHTAHLIQQVVHFLKLLDHYFLVSKRFLIVNPLPLMVFHNSLGLYHAQTGPLVFKLINLAFLC